MRKASALAALLITTATITGLTGAPASAASDGGSSVVQNRAEVLAQLERRATNMEELKAQINLQLKVAPGGKQTGVNEVSYDNGRFVVTYAMPNTIDGTPDCESGWFCFYDNTYWGYPRGKLSDCGWQDLARWGWHDRTESVDNSTGSSIQYIQHRDYGNPANGHSYDYTLFWNDPWAAISTVPYRNQADHVRRWC